MMQVVMVGKDAGQATIEGAAFRVGVINVSTIRPYLRL